MDDPQDATVRLGLIGLGRQAREYLSAAETTDDIAIVAAYDSSESSRSAHRNRSGLKVVDDLDHLPECALDGVILALPHHAYATIWKCVLGLGVPILKEKPLGRTVVEARRFFESARKHKVHLQTAIQRRFHPTYRKLRGLLGGKDVREVHAHLHLGFDPQTAPAGWRGDVDKAGGGALLDSGYHLLDLVHFLVGRFEVVSASLWNAYGRLLPGAAGRKGNDPLEEIDVEARLFGRQGATWIAIESLVGGEEGDDGKRKKSEGVVITTDSGIYHADRSTVRCNGKTLMSADPSWTDAMANQITAFADRLRRGEWSDQEIWDQLPVMRLIERANLEVRSLL